MKTVALVHTVMSVASTFGGQLKEYLGGDVKIYNIWDDFLAINPNEIGVFTTENKNRLFRDVKNAEMTGADVIVVTCSTLTPYMQYIRPFVTVPVIAVDDAMTMKAAGIGGKILAVATAGSTIQPTTDKVIEDAAKLGKTVEVDQMVLSFPRKVMARVPGPQWAPMTGPIWSMRMVSCGRRFRASFFSSSASSGASA